MLMDAHLKGADCTSPGDSTGRVSGVNNHLGVGRVDLYEPSVQMVPKLQGLDRSLKTRGAGRLARFHLTGPEPFADDVHCRPATPVERAICSRSMQLYPWRK